MKTFYKCQNPPCGELMAGTDKDVKKYCGSCNTAEKRTKMVETIKLENEADKQKQQNEQHNGETFPES